MLVFFKICDVSPDEKPDTLLCVSGGHDNKTHSLGAAWGVGGGVVATAKSS